MTWFKRNLNVPMAFSQCDNVLPEWEAAQVHMLWVKLVPLWEHLGRVFFLFGGSRMWRNNKTKDSPMETVEISSDFYS